MGAFVAEILIGMVCIVIGVANRKGNISMLHWYHRQRVREEDRLLFGKEIGLGMFILGGGIAASGVLSALALVTEWQDLLTIGTIVMGFGVVLGIGIIIHALFRYNKGIF